MAPLDLVGFMLTWGLPFTVYAALQGFALVRLRGYSLALALLPIPVMAYVVYVTVDAYHLHSNMWPILLILVSPGAAVFLVALIFIAGRSHR